MQLYECGICGSYHPWGWNSDCRDDANRYADEEDYAERNAVDARDVEVLSWDDRCKEDARTDAIPRPHPNFLMPGEAP